MENNSNDYFKLYKQFIVNSKIYLGTANVSFARAKYKKEFYYYKDYDQFIKKFPKALDKLELGEFYNVDVFYVIDPEQTKAEDCIKFSENYPDLVGVQGVAGEWKRIEKNKNSTMWIDSDGNFWDPVIDCNPQNLFEFDLGVFDFDWDSQNYLVIFYKLD